MTVVFIIIVDFNTFYEIILQNWIQGIGKIKKYALAV